MRIAVTLIAPILTLSLACDLAFGQNQTMPERLLGVYGARDIPHGCMLRVESDGFSGMAEGGGGSCKLEDIRLDSHPSNPTTWKGRFLCFSEGYEEEAQISLALVNGSDLVIVYNVGSPFHEKVEIAYWPSCN